MAIVLILTAESAAAVQGVDVTDPVVSAIREAGATAYAMPATSPDDPGARTFLVETKDPSRLLETLRRLPGVEASYIKPQDELP